MTSSIRNTFAFFKFEVNKLEEHIKKAKPHEARVMCKVLTRKLAELSSLLKEVEERENKNG